MRHHDELMLNSLGRWPKAHLRTGSFSGKVDLTTTDNSQGGHNLTYHFGMMLGDQTSDIPRRYSLKGTIVSKGELSRFGIGRVRRLRFDLGDRELNIRSLIVSESVIVPPPSATLKEQGKMLFEYEWVSHGPWSVKCKQRRKDRKAT